MTVFSVTIIIAAVFFFKDEILSRRVQKELREAQEVAKSIREAYLAEEKEELLYSGGEKKNRLDDGRGRKRC